MSEDFYYVVIDNDDNGEVFVMDNVPCYICGE